MILLVTILTFALVAGTVVAAWNGLTAQSAVTERLRTMAEAPAAPRARRRRAGPGPLSRLLAGLGRFAGAPPGGLTRALAAAGLRSPHAALVFTGTRTLVSLAPALLVLVPQVSAGAPLLHALVVATAVWGVGHVGCNLWLRRSMRRRTRRIVAALPDTLDLMIVCLEAGLGLNATIARVGRERASLDDPLSHEFAQVTHELTTGRSREDALRGLGERNGVDDLKSLTALIIQSDRLGASMARTLRVHADLLRTKRRQRAEEAARKLPIKILVPLAFFILPALFLVAAGPALMQITQLATMIGPE